MTFQGEFNNSVDPKGRASIPAKFRDVLATVYGDECLVVTKNWEGGLSAYPLSRWGELLGNVEKYPAGERKNAILRVLIAPAVECGFDKQGRILIPESLRTYAGLQKDIAVIGMADRIEIYSQAMHDDVTRSSVEVIKNDPQDISGMGF
jgi:MraZ protein